MPALCHTRRGRFSQTDGTRGRLCLRGSNNLQDIVPIKMDIGVLSLSVIVSTWIHHKSVICVDVPRLIHGMITTPQTPRITSSTAIRPSGTIITVTMVLLLGIWSRWQGELHQMSDALLSASAMRILHAEGLEILILIQSTKLLAGLVLGFGRLLIARCRRRRIVVGPARGRGGVVLEELLCLGEISHSGTDSGLGGFGAVDLARQRQRAGIRHEWMRLPVKESSAGWNEGDRERRRRRCSRRDGEVSIREITLLPVEEGDDSFV